MAHTQAQVVIGYPEFVSDMVEKREKFVHVMQGIPPLMYDLFSEAHSEPLHKVCRHLAKMVANSVNAVLLLGMNGLGNDCLKVVRSMFEASVNVAYLRQHPEEFDDYFDFHFIVARNRNRYLEKYNPAALQRLTRETAINNAGFDNVESRYRKNPKKPGKVRGRWSKKSLGEICAELHLEDHYLTFYDLSSHIIHADISGVLAQGDRKPGVLDVEIAPSDLHVDLALRSAHAYLVLAVSEYIKLARPDKQAIAGQIEKDFVDVWKK
jgi:hypothetical protein